MALPYEHSKDPETIEIIERCLIAGKKWQAVNEALEAAGKQPMVRQTIYAWMKRPNVVAGREEVRKRILEDGYGDRLKRKAKLENLIKRMDRVITERSATMGDVPGGSSGLLAEDVKGVGSGDAAREVKLYRVDTSLIQQMRETLKQIAQEVGEWTEKRDITSNGEAVKAYIGVDIDNV